MLINTNNADVKTCRLARQRRGWLGIALLKGNIVRCKNKVSYNFRGVNVSGAEDYKDEGAGKRMGLKTAPPPADARNPGKPRPTKPLRRKVRKRE